MAPDFSLMGKLMHGDAIGLSGVLTLNPRNSPYKSGIEPAPMPLIRKRNYFANTKLMDNDIFSRSAELLRIRWYLLYSV